MKKKVRNISIIILIVGTIIFSIGTVIQLKSEKSDTLKDNKTEKKSAQDNTADAKFDPNENRTPTYDEILTRTKNDYSGEDVDIELVEEDTRFILTIRSRTDNSIINKFYIDKETGVYIEENETNGVEKKPSSETASG